MRQYQKPDMSISVFESENMIMSSGNNAFTNIMNQLTETFGVDKTAIDTKRYENWGDSRFE